MGWIRVEGRRDSFSRSGSTFGKGFNTARAVRVVALTNTSAKDGTTEFRFNDLRILSGPVTGEVEYCYIYVRDADGYVAKSGPSAILSRVVLGHQGVVISIPEDPTRDPQVNFIWVFRRGRNLPTFHRIATAAVTGTGAMTVTDITTDDDALIANIQLEEDNVPPPVDIIGIEGPYFDRMFALTKTHLYISRRGNPDSFPSTKAIQVAGTEEQALWVRKALGGLYIGTTRDIYILSGDGAELPDGTLFFSLRPLNIDNPPLSSAVAQEGNLLVYLASDGWRAISGGGSRLLVGPTSLLYRDKTRHGVPALHRHGRFRATISGGHLVAITPEGAAGPSTTNTIYRYRFSTERWYRHVYPSSWQSIARLPDGIIVGDSEGFVWALDSGNTDGGAPIPVTLWTKVDDMGHPFQRKDPYHLRMLIDTGGAGASVDPYLDNSTTPATTISVARSTFGETVHSLSAMSSFRRLQMRITGLFNTFLLAGYHVGLHPLPPVVRGHTTPHNFGFPGVKTITALQLRICTLGAPVSITPVFDNVDLAAFTVTSPVDEPINYTYQFASPVQAAELFLKLGGDVEIYEWAPVVSSRRPLGVRVWDSGPMDLGTSDTVWIREIWVKLDSPGATLRASITFDEQIYPEVTAVAPAGTHKVPLIISRSVKGRVPRIIIRSTVEFFPYWVEFVTRFTDPVTEKNTIRIDSGLGGSSSPGS